MPVVNLSPARSALLVIDVQTGLIPFIYESDRMLERIRFMVRMANMLRAPVIATEQNPVRLGHTDGAVRAELEEPALEKMEFAVDRCPECLAAIRETGRDQIVVVGLETHICIAQTARGLHALGFEVVVCADAVSARSLDRHKLGMEQIRDAGIVPAHSESVAYEWLGSAEHPSFRAALAIVKEAGG